MNLLFAFFFLFLFFFNLSGTSEGVSFVSLEAVGGDLYSVDAVGDDDDGGGGGAASSETDSTLLPSIPGAFVL